MVDNFSDSEAARYLLGLREAAESFRGFVTFMHPDFKIPHFHEELIEVLDALERNTLGKTKVMVNMPVRHGKTWLFSTCYPAYYMARKPDRKMLACAYSGELAQTMGKDTRNLCQDPRMHQIFPEFELAKDSQAANDWRTTKKGKFYSCGLDGSTSGRPANLLLWDDLLKNRESADSPTQRNKAWSHYVSALIKRLEPEVDGSPAQEIGVMTRWHQDDPPGRIIESDDYKEGDWHHIVHPAISMKPSKILLSRYELPKDDPRYVTKEESQKLPYKQRDVHEEIETALWPERFPMSYLNKQRRIDPSEFAALFQQEPYTKGGQILKSSWWNIIPQEEVPENFISVIVACDTAFKTGNTNDFSVLMVLGLGHDGNIYVLDVLRDRLAFPDLKRKVIATNTVWRGRGLRGLYIEDAASGQSLIQDLRLETGMSIIPVKVIRDKVSRVNSVSPIVEGGRVYLPQNAPWLDEFLLEAEAFPNGTYDDQVDCLSMGLDALSRISSPGMDMLGGPIEMGHSLHAQQTNVISMSPLGKYKPLGEL